MANGPGKRFLVLDVGGSGIKYATATASGELGPRETLLTSYTTHKEFIDAIVGIVEANRPVDGIAISTCGELDPATGYMYTGGALTFNAGTNFITALEGRCGLPTTVENDANCALIAEMRDGALTDVDSGVVIVLGTAIGGAIMLGREVYHGARFHSGHFSFLAVNVEDVEHVPVAFSGGATGLLDDYRLLRGQEPDITTGREFFARLDDGSPAATESLRRLANRLAAVIVSVQAVLDVEAFAIGGGISSQEVLIDAIAADVTRRYDEAPLVLPRPQIHACRYRNDANLLGAVWHHLAGR